MTEKKNKLKRKNAQPKKRGRPPKKKPPDPRRLARNRTYPPYNITKLCARQESKAVSRATYIEWHRSNNITHIPATPEKVYKEEWEGWGEFLGTGNLFGPIIDKNIEDGLAPFWEAARFVQSLNLRNQKEWIEYYNNNDIPKGIPKDPSKWYPNEWKLRSGWETWLGTDSINNKQDITKKIEVQQKIKENLYGVLLWEMGDPNNVLTIYKSSSQMSITDKRDSGAYRLLQCYDLSDDKDQELFNQIMDKHTTIWYGNELKRLTPNWNQLKWDLDCQLLIFRI